MPTDNQYYVYIMTNRSGTLYVGLTNNIKKRVYEHKSKLVEGFTNKTLDLWGIIKIDLSEIV